MRSEPGPTAGQQDTPTRLPAEQPKGIPIDQGEAKSAWSDTPDLRLQLPSVWEPALFKAIRAKGTPDQEWRRESIAARHASGPSFPAE